MRAARRDQSPQAEPSFRLLELTDAAVNLHVGRIEPFLLVILTHFTYGEIITS